MTFNLMQPNLEERFLPPKNWQIKKFTNPKTSHDIAYRTSLIDNPKATVICLPGLSEYGEKYIETAHFFNKQGYDVYIIDWAYQGLSTRFKDNYQKRHSDGYDTDISDLHHLITNEIITEKPVHILAHSMGGHIGLRYIAEHPEVNIKSISASTPMISIHVMKYLCDVSSVIFSLLHPIHTKYLMKGCNWQKDNRKDHVGDIFSSNPIRENVHDAWCVPSGSHRL